MQNTIYFFLIILFFSIFLVILKKEKLKKIAANVFSEKKEENYQPICPKCGSTEIKNNFTNRAGIAYGASIGKMCNECGYEGQFYIEVEEKSVKRVAPKIKEEGKDKKIEQIDMTVAKGYAFFARISGVILILFGVFIIIIEEEIFSGITFILYGIFLYILGKWNKHEELKCQKK